MFLDLSKSLHPVMRYVQKGTKLHIQGKHKSENIDITVSGIYVIGEVKKVIRVNSKNSFGQLISTKTSKKDWVIQAERL